MSAATTSETTPASEAAASRPIIEIEAEICAVAGSMAIARARLLHLIGEFDAAEGWRETGALSCAHWLADLLDIEVSTAREKVRVARALRSLPGMAVRFDAGTLSYAKVRQLTRVATARNEHELVELADRHPAGALARVLADWQERHDPEAAAARRRQARGLSVCPLVNGNRLLAVQIAPEEMAVVESLIDLEMQRAPASHPADGSSLRPTLRQQRADAFVRLIQRLATVTAGDGSGASASTGRVRAELVLHRRIGEITLTDGSPLPASVARRLTCDADVRLMTHWPDGSPADVGRRSRLVTPRLRQLVYERAGGQCEHQGCTARFFLEVHHVVHWYDGGTTDLRNLRLLCSGHHDRRHR